MGLYTADVRIDFRTFVGKLRQYLKDCALATVNSPGMKEEIYEDIYYSILMDNGMLPEDTGAYKLSPSTSTPEFIGVGESDRRPHYACGIINERGLYYDPITVSNVTGKEYHYGPYVQGYRPQWVIHDSWREVLDIVRDHLVEGWKEDE